MAKKNFGKPQAKKFPLIAVLVGVLALGVVLAGGGFAFAASQEQNDSFCASCHTQPESTFFERFNAAQPVDLASYHHAKKTACIDCHSGVGLGGRLQAELLGAHNAFAFYTGTAVQPAVLAYPIRDDSCIKCHEKTIKPAGTTRNNHFHPLLAKWQAADPNAGGCVSCHSGHATNGTAQTRFQNKVAYTPVCNACHKVLRTDDD